AGTVGGILRTLCAHCDHERWREIPSSPDLSTTEIRARRNLAPPGSWAGESQRPIPCRLHWRLPPNRDGREQPLSPDSIPDPDLSRSGFYRRDKGGPRFWEGLRRKCPCRCL